jgi:protein-L-isoaspartate(D-aspartate) O-methyltransferase
MTRPPRQGRFPLPLDRVHGPGRAAARDMLRPQRPLQMAAADAERTHAPAGLGLDTAAVRERMVCRLRTEGITDDRVLEALAVVERHRFVDSALVIQAYENTSLPIGHGQTISKPSVVARKLALLLEGEGARAQGHLGRVLEIGTGCGYQAALLARLGRSLVSIERVRPLADRARAALAAAGVRALVLHGDGRLGHAARSPYDTIVSAAGGEDLPAAWLEQLAVGGRLVAPLHDARLGAQRLVVIDRGPQGLRRRELDAVYFVPLKSGIA